MGITMDYALWRNGDYFTSSRRPSEPENPKACFWSNTMARFARRAGSLRSLHAKSSLIGPPRYANCMSPNSVSLAPNALSSVT
jgi:hypothetical protein